MCLLPPSKRSPLSSHKAGSAWQKQPHPKAAASSVRQPVYGARPSPTIKPLTATGIRTKQPIRTGFIKLPCISNEMQVRAYKQLLAVHILTKDLDYWKITRKHLKTGNFTDEQNEMLRKAAKISQEKYKNIKFVKMFDNDTSRVVKTIRNARMAATSNVSAPPSGKLSFQTSVKVLLCSICVITKATAKTATCRPAWYRVLRSQKNPTTATQSFVS